MYSFSVNVATRGTLNKGNILISIVVAAAEAVDADENMGGDESEEVKADSCEAKYVKAFIGALIGAVVDVGLDDDNDVEVSNSRCWSYACCPSNCCSTICCCDAACGVPDKEVNVCVCVCTDTVFCA